MNRTLEKEITAFAESLELHLARLVEEASPILATLPTSDRRHLISQAMVDLWNRRNYFNPKEESLALFFRDILKSKAARFVGRIVFTYEEGQVLAALGFKEDARPLPAVSAVQYAKSPAKQKLDAPRKPGKECPPCWRCKWFYGWLPVREFVPEKNSDPEVQAACERIDRRKIAIAEMVRAGGTWSEADLQQE